MQRLLVRLWRRRCRDIVVTLLCVCVCVCALVCTCAISLLLHIAQSSQAETAGMQEFLVRAVEGEARGRNCYV